MLAKQIICNVIMFAVHTANIAWIVYRLITLPAKMKIMSLSSDGLTDKEKYDLTYKNFYWEFLRMVLYSVVGLIIVAITRYFDGLVDPGETYLGVPILIAAFGSVVFVVFFEIYQHILIKKYQLTVRYAGMPISRRGNSITAGLGYVNMGLGMILSVSTGLVVYTIVLLFI